MRTLVTSDIHVGSPYFEPDHLFRLLDALPDDVSLVLNGDTLHAHASELEGSHAEALSRIIDESTNREVVWLHGNHDEDYEIADSKNVIFKSDHSIDKRLYVSHGEKFMPLKATSRFAVSILRPLRLKVRGESVLSARFIKTVPPLYGYLLFSVRRNAVRFARRNGYQAVACGHLHSSADTRVGEVRYFNTGSWIEWPASCVWVTDETVELRNAAEISF